MTTCQARDWPPRTHTGRCSEDPDRLWNGLWRAVCPMCRGAFLPIKMRRGLECITTYRGRGEREGGALGGRYLQPPASLPVVTLACLSCVFPSLPPPLSPPNPHACAARSLCCLRNRRCALPWPRPGVEPPPQPTHPLRRHPRRGGRNSTPANANKSVIVTLLGGVGAAGLYEGREGGDRVCLFQLGDLRPRLLVT